MATMTIEKYLEMCAILARKAALRWAEENHKVDIIGPGVMRFAAYKKFYEIAQVDYLGLKEMLEAEELTTVNILEMWESLS